jgi:fructose-1,6-bisphosphatase/inositol monophosphatase family enzyme
MPLFGTLIALVDGQGSPRIGLIDFPAMSERWLGIPGKTTRLNGEPARSGDCRDIAQARCYCTSPDMFEGDDLARFEKLSRSAGMRRFGGDCYAYALLASGHCDLVVEAGLQPYDYLPLVPVIQGAGGRISDWQGRALGFGSDGRVIAAANETLWLAALDLLR